MQKKEGSRKRIVYLLGVCLFLFLFNVVLYVVANFRPLYQYFFETYHIYNNFQGLERSLLDGHFFSVLNYVSLSGGVPDSAFFSREDLLHLQDVRTIFGIFYGIGALCGALAVFIVFYFKVRAKEFLHAIKAGVALQLTFAIVLLLVALTIFHDLFIAFHRIAFSNEYWQLDPATSNLIKYLPEVIFRDISLLLFTVPLASAIIIYISAVIWFRLINKDAEQER